MKMKIINSVCIYFKIAKWFLIYLIFNSSFVDSNSAPNSSVNTIAPNVAFKDLSGGRGIEKDLKNDCFGPNKQIIQISSELNTSNMFQRLFAAPNSPSISNRNTEEIHAKWTNKDKLKIFVVLHSHNDAGIKTNNNNNNCWLRTFEEYYQFETKNILNHVLKQLTLDPKLKFVWSEVSFFDLWWKDLPRKKRLEVKALIDKGQLEFVGGGWVQHDEATTHYLSIITQIMEGHQWLKQYLNVTVRSGWAIDSFGLSSTSQFLLERSGMKNTVFSRVHHLLNELLVKEKKTEFYWRQLWDTKGTTDLFSYLMPYGTYDMSSTCGPDHEDPEDNKCKVFSLDYYGEVKTTLKSASILLNQYRKKAKLFHTQNLLVPIGSDFSWQSEPDWSNDVKNLKEIFVIINTKYGYNTEIKFATLDEYFNAVQKENEEPNVYKFPVFSGDFFPYSSESDSYWSGYYTSRIYHKTKERKLMTLLRSAQLIYTLTAAEISREFSTFFDFPIIGEMLQKIVESRRILSLFQHHDAISGTSKKVVMQDYAFKLLNATQECHLVIQKSIHILQILGQTRKEVNSNSTSKQPKLSKKLKIKVVLDKLGIKPNLVIGEDTKNIYPLYIPLPNPEEPKEIWEHKDEEINKVLNLGPSNPVETVVVFNSLAKNRKQIVKLLVTNPQVKVLIASNGEEIDSEIHPYFPTENFTINKEFENKRFQLCFVAELRPIEIKYFQVFYVESKNEMKKRSKIASWKIIDEKSLVKINVSNREKESKPIQISNSFLKINFNDVGTMESVEIDGTLYPIKITFHKYRSNRSGLYLFVPFGEAEAIETNSNDQTNQIPIITVLKGSLESYVEVSFPNVRLKHRVTLRNVVQVTKPRLIKHEHLQTNQDQDLKLELEDLESLGIHIENTIDISKQTNYELIMRIKTEIKSGTRFYTDSNGFQMLAREYRKNVSIGGNYYPVASSAFIEDQELRMTLLVGQPGGLSSLTSGQLEIMLDRITIQDDGKGVGTRGDDNLLTVSKFQIILKKASNPLKICSQDMKSHDQKAKAENPENTNSKLPLLSLEANLAQLNLLHPVLVYKKNITVKNEQSHKKFVDYVLKSFRKKLNTSQDESRRSVVTSPSMPLPLSCDIHLLAAIPLVQFTDSTIDGKKTMEDKSIFMSPLSKSALLFHRFGIDNKFTNAKFLQNCIQAKPKVNGNQSNYDSSSGLGHVKISKLFKGLFKRQLQRTSLTLSHKQGYYDGLKSFKLDPMEIYAFIAKYSGSNRWNDYKNKFQFVSSMPTLFPVKSSGNNNNCHLSTFVWIGFYVNSVICALSLHIKCIV